MTLADFHPAVAAWFSPAFGSPTDVQQQIWPAIRRRDNTLIAAPTAFPGCHRCPGAQWRHASELARISHHRLATNGGEKCGLREQFHPDYYGAFVIDPDGHNIEAVCHTLE